MTIGQISSLKRWAGAAAVAGFMAVPANFAMAQEEAGPNTGSVSVSGGFDIVSEYWFRGIAQENQGFIIQPYLDVTFAINENVSFTIGTWNSVHDGPSGDDGVGNAHYELDLYAGVDFTVEQFSFGIYWTSYTSPNGVFSTVSEIAATVGYDDSGLWGESGFALAPYVTIAFEVNGAADGTGDGDDVYLELGVEPSFAIYEDDSVSLTLAVPVAVGLSLSDYYESTVDGSDDTFGFFTIGAVLSTPVTFIPAEFGEWEASIYVKYLLLGDSAQDIAGGIDENRIIAGFSLGFSY